MLKDQIYMEGITGNSSLLCKVLGKEQTSNNNKRCHTWWNNDTNLLLMLGNGLYCVNYDFDSVKHVSPQY